VEDKEIFQFPILEKSWELGKVMERKGGERYLLISRNGHPYHVPRELLKGMIEEYREAIFKTGKALDYFENKEMK
jgi:hypothetical protein